MILFDYLASLTYRKEQLDFSNEEVSKEYSAYWINRWLSMVEIFLPIVKVVNQYNIPKDVHYDLYLSCLPKRKYYFQYIKKTNDLNIEDKQYIAKHFDINIRDVDDALKILSEKEAKEIINIYKQGAKYENSSKS
jgi:hypothetical protein